MRAQTHTVSWTQLQTAQARGPAASQQSPEQGGYWASTLCQELSQVPLR